MSLPRRMPSGRPGTERSASRLPAIIDFCTSVTDRSAAGSTPLTVTGTGSPRPLVMRPLPSTAGAAPITCGICISFFTSAS